MFVSSILGCLVPIFHILPHALPVPVLKFFNKIKILIIFNFMVHECMTSRDLCKCPLFSNNALWFSDGKFCLYFVKFIPKYSIVLDANENGTVS